MKNIIRKIYGILTAVMLLSALGCGGKEEGPIVWQKIKTMDAGQYALVQVDDSFLRAEEHFSETVYCNGYVYFFKVRVIDDMRLNPEYFSVGCMNMETGETRLLYEAPKYIVLQDIIAAEDKVYWVEIDYNEVSKWKIAYYDLEQDTLGVVREGILEEDTCWEPVLTLSGRYILWDEKKPDGAYTCFQYSLDDGALQEWQIQEYNSYDSFRGEQVYDGEPVYLSEKDGSFEIKSREKVFHQIEAENAINYSITQQGIVWVDGEAVNRTGWFIRMKNNVVSGEAQALPFPKIFTAELYEEWILLVNETAAGYRYYAINVNTGEQFYVPAEGFYYPRCSADGTVYFKGSGGRVLLLNLPDKQIF